jgi:hypothetical protein
MAVVLSPLNLDGKVNQVSDEIMMVCLLKIKDELN